MSPEPETVQRQRWERLRRLVLAFVAELRETDPEGRYTLRVDVVPREGAAKKTA